MFGLTTNLLDILEIWWMSTAVVKNVLFLEITVKDLEQVFPNHFNKMLIKCGKIVSCLMQIVEKIWEVSRNVGAYAP